MVPLDVPDAPTGPLRAELSGGRGVQLEWRAPADDSNSAVSGYVLEMRDLARSTWQPLRRLDARSTSASVDELPAGRELLFHVSALNRAGAGPYLTLREPTYFAAPPGAFALLHKSVSCLWLFK